jgi:hypothetical protein
MYLLQSKVAGVAFNFDGNNAFILVSACGACNLTS